MLQHSNQIYINLLPGHYQERRNKRLLSIFVAVVILWLVVLGIGYRVEWVKLAEQQQLQNDLQKKIRLYSGVQAQLNAEQAMKQQMVARKNALQTLMKNRTTIVAILDEIEKSTPPGAVLNSLQFDGQKISLTGTADSHDTVAEFIAGLAANSRFKQVAVMSSTAGEDGRFTFSLQCNWEGGEQ